MEQTSKPIITEEQAEDIIAKAKKNKKAIMWCLVAAFAVIIVVLIWLMLAQTGARKADEAVAKADAAKTDSVALVLYKEAASAGYKSGHRAAAQAAVILYGQGKYEEALEYLDDADLDDEIAAAGVYSLAGDCYVNLEKYDEALSSYEKAISKADENPEIVPFVLVKMANIYRAQTKYDDEAEAYETIINEYPSYATSTRIDINKYYERAKAMAAKAK